MPDPAAAVTGYRCNKEFTHASAGHALHLHPRCIHCDRLPSLLPCSPVPRLNCISTVNLRHTRHADRPRKHRLRDPQTCSSGATAVTHPPVARSSHSPRTLHRTLTSRSNGLPTTTAARPVGTAARDVARRRLPRLSASCACTSRNARPAATVPRPEQLFRLLDARRDARVRQPERQRHQWPWAAIGRPQSRCHAL